MSDKEKLEVALNMLAQWCAMIECNGTGWDDWDEAYKDCYRPGPLTEELKLKIEEHKKMYKWDNYN